MAKNDVDIRVRYTADTSQLEKQMSNLSKINLNFNGTSLKNDILAPVNQALKELRNSLSGGLVSSKETDKTFSNFVGSVEEAKLRVQELRSEITNAFNSRENQRAIADFRRYGTEIEKVRAKIDKWNSTYSDKALANFRQQNNVPDTSTERAKVTKDLETQLELGLKLAATDERRLAAIKEYQKLLNERSASPKGEMMSELRGLENRQSQLDILDEKTYTSSITSLNNVMSRLNTTLSTTSSEQNRLKSATEEGRKALEKEESAAKNAASAFTSSFLGFSLSNVMQTALRQGIAFFKEYDEILTRTSMVTGMSRGEVNKLTSSYSKLATQLSSTIKDVASAQLVFYQQGLSTNNALKMTQASIAVSKTAGIDAAEAADRLTAAVRGYQLAASDAMSIADKMSALDAHAASSVDELTIAMQKSASQARMAGLDLDYYMAYLSTMQEVTREAPENIGTAMKSITSRLQEIRDIGKIEEDGTTFSNVAKALTSVGIAAVDASGQLRSLQDIMNELGPMWASLDRNHQAYIATVLAGNRQQSRFVALMDNYDRAMELVGVSQNASGESARQLRAYNQGLEASFTALSNAWQQFATNLTNSSIIKRVVDLITNLLNVINKLPKGFTSTIFVITAFSKAAKTMVSILNSNPLKKIGDTLGFGEATKDLKSFSKQAEELATKHFKQIGDWAEKGLGKASKAIEGMGNSFEASNESIQANTEAIGDSEEAYGKEVDQSKATAAQKGIEAEATSDLTTKLEEQKSAMDSNDPTYAQEIFDSETLTKSQKGESQGLDAIIKARNDFFSNYLKGAGITPTFTQKDDDLMKEMLRKARNNVLLGGKNTNGKEIKGLMELRDRALENMYDLKDKNSPLIDIRKYINNLTRGGIKAAEEAEKAFNEYLNGKDPDKAAEILGRYNNKSRFVIPSEFSKKYPKGNTNTVLGYVGAMKEYGASTEEIDKFLTFINEETLKNEAITKEEAAKAEEVLNKISKKGSEKYWKDVRSEAEAAASSKFIESSDYYQGLQDMLGDSLTALLRTWESKTTDEFEFLNDTYIDLMKQLENGDIKTLEEAKVLTTKSEVLVEENNDFKKLFSRNIRNEGELREMYQSFYDDVAKLYNAAYAKYVEENGGITTGATEAIREDVEKQVEKLLRTKKYGFFKDGSMPSGKTRINNAVKRVTSEPESESVPLESPEEVKTLGDKLKGLGKYLNMSTILGAMFAKSIAQMVGNMLGLDDEINDVIGDFVGLTSQLKQFGVKGIVAAAVITAGKWAIKKFIPTAAQLEERLSKLQTKMDEINSKKNNISTNLQTYKKLSTVLNKTEEETEELKGATDALAEALPAAVIGYNALGEAIIDTNIAMEEYNRLSKEAQKNATEQLDTLQSGQNGATVWGTIGHLGKNLALNLVEGAAGIGGKVKVAQWLGWEEDIAFSPDNLGKANLKAEKEYITKYYSDLWSLGQTQLADFINNGSNSNTTQRQSLVDSILSTQLGNMLNGNSLSEADIKDNYTVLLNKIKDKLSTEGFDDLASIVKELTFAFKLNDSTWAESEKSIKEALQEKLKNAGFAQEDIDLIMTSVLNITFAGDVNLINVEREIEKAISESTDKIFQEDARKFLSTLKSLQPQVLQAMNSVGLLDTKFIQLWKTVGNGQAITDLFTNSKGEIDATAGAIVLLDKMYGEIQAKRAKEKEYVELLERLEATNKKDTNEYKKTKVELEKIREETRDWEDGINSINKLLTKVTEPTFGEIASKIKEISSQFSTLRSLAESLGESNGKMSLDNIATMFDLLDSFETEVNNTESAVLWDSWLANIELVNKNLSVENGILVANAEAIQGINNLTQISAKLKMQETLLTLEQRKEQLTYENELLKAQRTAVQAAIERLEAGETVAEAEEAAMESLQSLDRLTQVQRLQNEINMDNKILRYTAEFATKYSNILQAARDGSWDGSYEDLQASYGNIVEEMKKDMQDNLKLYFDPTDSTKTLNRLTKLRDSLDDQIKRNDGTINNVIKLKEDVTKLLAADGTNLAKMAEGWADSTDEYNERLEKTLTLLEKIAGLQHTIDENDTFKELYTDAYDGESVGRLMGSNLKLAQQQYSVYKDLFDMQQNIVNQKAGDLLDSPYGSLFKIDENGDIGWSSKNAYSTYLAMSNHDKENIDTLVESYQTARDALRDTEKDMVKNAQRIQAVRNQMLEWEIEIENTLVETIKNREKILHEARVKALEDEIDMIEKAVSARKKARENDESAKEVYEAEEALRRATLDSSGKNNSSLLQLQKDLEEKQIEIAEKRFEDDMDNRKQWLTDVKDAETETYEYRLETMTWYWEEVKKIQEAGEEEVINTLIHWNDEYLKTSKLQQDKMVNEWGTTLGALASLSEQGFKVDELTEDLGSMTTEVEKLNIQVKALAGNWKDATTNASTYNSSATGASTYKYTGGENNSGEKEDKETVVEEPKGREATPYDRYLSQTVEIAGTGSYTGYEYSKFDSQGHVGDKGTFKKSSALFGGNENITIEDIQKINGTYHALGIIQSGPEKGKHLWVPIYELQQRGLFGGKLVADPAFGRTVYASGGMVDYTGPAWVDGTKTHPEAFLSAYQTEQIGALANALNPNSVSNVSSSNDVSIGTISFNVASMSSASDGKKALDTFVQGVNEMMAKKGVGTRLNTNINS